MQTFNSVEMLQQLAMSHYKYTMFLADWGDYHPEALRIAPYLTAQQLMDGMAWVTFDNIQELETNYKTLNVDGSNVYIYALTCDPSGQLLHENT
jgi:hypothetical protein